MSSPSRKEKEMARHLIGNRKGAAMVELAIILPILLILLFGIVECALIMYDKAMITNASREGARAGIVFRSDGENYSPLDEGQIKLIVNNYLAAYLVSFAPGSANTEVLPNPPAQCPPLNPSVTREINVTVTYQYNFLVLPNFITSLVPVNLSASTVMRCEG